MVAVRSPTGRCCRLGPGCHDAREYFVVAPEAGINFSDTADVSSIGLGEETTGHWLEEVDSRDDFVVAAKAWSRMGPRTKPVG